MTDTTRIPPSIKSFSRATTSQTLAISERQVDRLIKMGKLSAYYIGSRGIRITEDSISKYIESRQVGAAQTKARIGAV